MPKQPQPEEAEGLESQKRVTFVEPQEHNNNKTIGDHTRITTTTTMSSTVATTTGKDPERSDVNINNPTSSYFEMEEDDIDRGWVSWLIPAIVVVNIVVFIVVMYVNNCPKQHGRGGRCMARFLGRFSFQPLIENPLFGPSSGTLTKMGAVEWTKIVQNHQLWRLITSIWLHAGIIHLLINMLSLVFVGIRLEQQFGFLRVGAIYLVSGIGGGILSSLFIQKINVSSVGASGALFGLVGAMLAELITNWTLYTNKVAALVTLVFIIAVNLVVGILPHVNNLAHIGGFITGLLLGFVLLLRPHIGYLHSGTAGGRVIWSKYSVYQILLWVVSILLLLIWFIIGMVMLVRGVNGYDHCHWCRYLTCVPTTKWHCTT